MELVLSSIMIDDSASQQIPIDNVRSLLFSLSIESDRRFTSFREGTRYAAVRPSDVRVFVAASRAARNVSEIAVDLHVSRQAVHGSVQRLAALGVLELQAIPGNRRDKLVSITTRGIHARATSIAQIRAFEAELAEYIGLDGVETMRQTLALLLARMRARNGADLSAPPDAKANAILGADR